MTRGRQINPTQLALWLAFIAAVAGCGNHSVVAPVPLVDPLVAKDALFLVSPDDGAVMDNGRYDQADQIIWRFGWSGPSNAPQYHLRVQHVDARLAVINDSTLVDQNYTLVRLGSYIIERNRFDWRWRVRALVNGQWGPWTPERSFDVELADTDPPGASPRSATTPLPIRPQAGSGLN